MAEYKEIAPKPLSESGSKTTYTVKSNTSDKLKGGKADNRPDSDFDEEQLRTGIKVEREHTKDAKIAKEVAKDHLSEIPDYYKRLNKMEDTAKKDVRKSLDRANNLIKALKESLNEEEMDLKKTDEEDVDKGATKLDPDAGLPEGTKKLKDALTKALKASSIASLSRRQRMDAAYRAGVALGREGVPVGPSPVIKVEPAEIEVKDIGITTEQTRPLYEPPVVPVRRVATPFEIPPKKCGDHTYKVAKVGPQESKPFRSR